MFAELYGLDGGHEEGNCFIQSVVVSDTHFRSATLWHSTRDMTGGRAGEFEMGNRNINM